MCVIAFFRPTDFAQAFPFFAFRSVGARAILAVKTAGYSNASTLALNSVELT
jgi:hypothetical protein